MASQSVLLTGEAVLVDVVCVGIPISMKGLEPSILTGRNACVHRALIDHVEKRRIHLCQDDSFLAGNLTVLQEHVQIPS